jgi:hypothetical protein
MEQGSITKHPHIKGKRPRSVRENGRKGNRPLRTSADTSGGSTVASRNDRPSRAGEPAERTCKEVPAIHRAARERSVKEQPMANAGPPDGAVV